MYRSVLLTLTLAERAKMFYETLGRLQIIALNTLFYQTSILLFAIK